jgi:predicted negative regulator of RcsB-dependent stress response
VNARWPICRRCCAGQSHRKEVDLVDLLSEEEQWEELKAKLRSYAPAIIGGLLLGTALWVGWSWWGRHKDEQLAQASVQYDAMLNAYAANDVPKASALLEELKREYPDSIYVPAAQLAAAKMAVARNELDAAASALAAVADGEEERFAHIARLRLARIQVEQAKYDEAIATLAKVEPGPYAGAYAHVRGDALLRKGDTAGALREYRAARETIAKNAGGDAGEATALLDLKINDLQETP